MTKVTHTMFRTKVMVPDRERAIVFKDGMFNTMLASGKHTLPRAFWTMTTYEVEALPVNTAALVNSRLEGLYVDHAEALSSHLSVMETGTDEMAIAFLDGAARFVIPPESRRFVFRDAGDWTLNRIDLTNALEIEPILSRRLMKLTSDFIKRVKVDHGQVGLLSVDGRIVQTLEPGGHAFWAYGRVITVKIVDVRENAIDVTGQELLTRDRVSIRVNLSAIYRVVDPLKAVSVVKDFHDALYRALGVAFRRSLTDKTLDEVLAKKGVVDTEADAEVVAELAKAGVEVSSVMVKDIILPGEMREILNTVVVAEKEAEANVIRRREDTAATRALLNTAKVMADNPAMMRLKELEALESIADRVGTLTVHSGTKGLMEDIVSLSGK